MRKVVITGVGMETPMGNSLDEVRALIESGRSAVRVAPSSTESRARVCAYVESDLTQGVSSSLQKMVDRTTLLALQASDRAMADAGLAPGGFDATRMGTYIGCGSGNFDALYTGHETLFRKDTMAAMTLLKALPNAPASHVAIRHGLKGECALLAVACSSSAMAMGTAFRMIRHGYLDAALVGGVESPMIESSFRGWEAMRVLARPDLANPGATCKPYSKNRTGIVLGEGAALYVIESEENAKARGARIYATIEGYGTSADSSHITLPLQEGQVAAMKAVFADAGIGPSEIQYINAHGTATGQGDLIETRSVREAFGAHADSVPMSATKAIHGHTLGASGAIEMLAVLIALRDGVLAPTLNLLEPDPECDMDYIPNQARRQAVRTVMTNSFAFGGSNASMILTAG